MAKGSDSFWIIILLLFLLVEPLRDIVWSALLFADPMLLLILLLLVWYANR